MERIEFCELMVEAKKRSGISTSQVSFELKMLLPSLRRLEKGIHNFSVSKAIDYLHSINGYIQLHKNKTIYSIMQYEDIVQWLINERKDNYTKHALTQKTGCANGTIGNIESGKSVMSIDIFLRLSEVLGFSITIERQ